MYDPYCVEMIEIIYKDGSTYKVYDQNEDVDNTSYLVNGIGMNKYEIQVGMTFNRIVDVNQISQIKMGLKTFDVE